MSNEKSSVEPWQLILIIVLMIAFFGGLYVVNQAISAKIDSMEFTIDSKIEMVGRNIDQLKAQIAKPAPIAKPEPKAPAPAVVADASEAKADPEAAKESP